MTRRTNIQRIIIGALLGASAACRDMSPDTSPAQVAIAPAGTSSVVSGASLALTVVVTNASGGLVAPPAVTWTSSDATIANVAASGVVTGVRVGDASITATVGTIISAPVQVTVTPGAPARLVARTQPAGARSGVALTTQPVVEVQDAAGNTAPSPAITVTAIIATGGGTIVGSTATSVDGVATFSALAISGTVGDRTLSFSAPGLPSVTSVGLALGAGNAARLAIRIQPQGATSGAPLATQPVIELRDAAGNLATSANTTVTATLGNGTGTIANATAPVLDGIATFTSLALSGSPGDRTLTFSAPGLPAISSATFALAAAP